MSVADRLRRGVNLSHWYGQVYMEPGYLPSHFDDYMQDTDLQLIVETGFDHVRFPLALEQMLTDRGVGTSVELDEPFVGRVQREVARLQALGLAVVVDLHPENAFKDDLAARDDAVDRFVAVWAELARRFATHDPALTVLEVLNEPAIGDAARWAWILRRCLDVLAEAAPAHTVLVSGDHYSEVPRLLELPPLDHDRLVYNIHLYDPTALSHQGAGWAPEWVQQTRGLAYPPEESNLASLLADATDPRALAALVEYRDDAWDRARYRDLVAPAAAFAASRGASLTCNEFGVYQRFVPRDSRLRWLRDVTGVFAELGVGWTVWDYAGDFSVAVGERGARRADDDVVSALGLCPRPRLRT